MRRHHVVLCALICAARPALAQNGAFVIKLGRDTSAIEQFTRTATRIQGDGVVRFPRTVVRHFTVDMGADGRPTRMEVTITRPGAAADAPPIQKVVATFTRDSVFSELRRDTTVQSRRIALPGMPVPLLGGASSSWLAFELMVGRLRASRSDSLSLAMYQAGAPQPSMWSIRTLGRDSIWIYDGNDVFHARVDREGRILGVLPLSGTQQFTVERVSSVDINALATSSAARDNTPQGLGALSTRDTTRATAGGATLWIDYGRPAKRGRQIFGTTIVPYGEVWRTGANAATQFRTDRALEMGGVVLQPGFYTLWTIPSPTGWKLLINTQTGQWGTAHDATKDIFQLPMTTSTLPQPVERFVITVAPSGQGGTLNFDWDTTRASIPFTVR